MAKEYRKMQTRRDLRIAQWESIPASKKRGTKKPGSMKHKAKSAGKHA